MMFHRTRIKHMTNLNIDVSKNVIHQSINTKFLLYIEREISRSIGIIFKIRHYLDNHTFIYPYLIYCIEIWGNTHATHLNPLIKIQKRSIRTITYAHYQDHTGPLFDNQILRFFLISHTKNIFVNVQTSA